MDSLGAIFFAHFSISWKALLTSAEKGVEEMEDAAHPGNHAGICPFWASVS